MNKAPRRIVTGHDGTGKSVVAIDTTMTPKVSNQERGVDFYEIWNTTGSPVPVDNGPDPTDRPLTIPPPKLGSIIRYVDFEPESEKTARMDAAAAKAAFAAVGTAQASTWRPGKHPMMHRTETVDYGIVLEGEIVLILDDAEVPLKAGDVVVQRGTDHAWANRSDQPARMAFILLDGAFSPELRKLMQNS
ncbi:MAG TPA: cupin domain-containing protein [Ferrovibrio sp.]|uniref:cupin domain-containing protein n=1 Tax=Ferrovibrio sp. TaxID=1917215 RepID=UPI002ED439EF